MPRTFSGPLLTVLNSSVPTLATIIKVTRPDNQVFGFTSFDQDLVVAGVTYEKLSAASPSAVRSTEGTGVDNMDFSGLLNSNKITDVDILAGIWDNSLVELDLVDYTNPGGGVTVILTGKIGEITLKDGQYVAEFRSLSQRLQQEVVDQYTPTCRVAAFGDFQCASGGLIGTHPLSFYQRPGVAVVAVITPGTVFTVTNTDGTGFFDYGKATFTSGANNGISREVKTGTGNPTVTITVQEGYPFTISPGDLLTLEAGCDRNFSTCVNKFQNANNFRGEPYVPHLDVLLRRGRR
jgi:uncharacterized phage protein (TIGR02218 family)